MGTEMVLTAKQIETVKRFTFMVENELSLSKTEAQKKSNNGIIISIGCGIFSLVFLIIFKIASHGDNLKITDLGFPFCISLFIFLIGLFSTFFRSAIYYEDAIDRARLQIAFFTKIVDNLPLLEEIDQWIESTDKPASRFNQERSPTISSIPASATDAFLLTLLEQQTF